MSKRYDQAYFDRWYRDPRHRVNTPVGVRRKVRLVLGVAEALLERPVRSILDVGCGEAAWRSHFLDERPKADYLGMDSSEYVVERFGRTRGIRAGTFGTLGQIGITERFDLIVCCDVLQYVRTEEMGPGLRAVAGMLDGAAYLGAFTHADEKMGQDDGGERDAESEGEEERRSVGPVRDVGLRDRGPGPRRRRVVMLALRNTDERLSQDKTVSPAFLFAALLWHEVLSSWKTRVKQGARPVGAMHNAMDEVLAKQKEKQAIPHRHDAVIKEIWLMQQRFDQRSGQRPFRLLEQPRFRAGFDFLLLRCASGEADDELGLWWDEFQDASDARRVEMLQAEGSGEKKRRRRKPRKKPGATEVAEQAG